MPTPRQQLRSLGVPDAMIDTVKIDGKRLVAMEATKEATQPWDRMNKTEARYAAELEYMEQAGEIVAWRFEPINFRLAKKTFYRPDFMVVRQHVPLEFVEIKGGFVRDDAAVKYKLARELFPWFEWKCLQKTKEGWRAILNG